MHKKLLLLASILTGSVGLSASADDVRTTLANPLSNYNLFFYIKNLVTTIPVSDFFRWKSGLYAHSPEVTRILGLIAMQEAARAARTSFAVGLAGRYVGFKCVGSALEWLAAKKEKDAIKKRLRNGETDLDVTLLDGQRLVYKNGIKEVGPFLFGPHEIEG